MRKAKQITGILMAGIYCRYHIRLGMELYRDALERKKDEIGNCETHS